MTCVAPPTEPAMREARVDGGRCCEKSTGFAGSAMVVSLKMTRPFWATSGRGALKSHTAAHCIRKIAFYLRLCTEEDLRLDRSCRREFHRGHPLDSTSAASIMALNGKVDVSSWARSVSGSADVSDEEDDAGKVEREDWREIIGERLATSSTKKRTTFLHQLVKVAAAAGELFASRLLNTSHQLLSRRLVGPTAHHQASHAHCTSLHRRTFSKGRPRRLASLPGPIIRGRDSRHFCSPRQMAHRRGVQS